MGLETERKQRRRYIYFKTKEVDQIKKLLLMDKEKILRKHREAEESAFCLQKEELFDEIDAANANIQANQEVRFKTRDNLYLRKIEEQLKKIDKAYFGECEECGVRIDFERLKARPTAKMCTACQEMSEAGEKKNIGGRSKSLGRGIEGRL